MKDAGTDWTCVCGKQAGVPLIRHMHGERKKKEDEISLLLEMVLHSKPTPETSLRS